ncbi:MAG: hypothetical protein PHX70_12930 [Clostridium sp.]|nr:hypothetical protein [Clostridium sp.]
MNYLKKSLEFGNLFKITIGVFIFIYTFGALSDLDMFFHIKNGEFIYHNWIPQIDPYSIHNGLQYIQHEWLSDIIFYLVYSISGFTSLWIFKIIMAFIIFYVLYITNKLFTNDNKFVSYVIAGLAVIFISDFLIIRPQIFSYLIFILEILVLEKYEQTKKLKYLFGLPVLGLALANLHGATIPIFYVLIAVYMASNFISTENSRIRITSFKVLKYYIGYLLIFSVLSLAAMAINPHGMSTVVYMINISGQNMMFDYINELQPLNINTYFGAIMFTIFFTIVLTIILVRRIPTIKQLIFIFGTFIVALSAIRFASYFVIFSSIVLAQYISQIFSKEFIETNKTCIALIKNRNLVGNFLFIIAFMVPIQLMTFKPGITDFSNFPTGIVPILQQQTNLRLYNEFDAGHFLIYNNIKVFVDGRAEMYTTKCNDVSVLDDYFNVFSGKVNIEEVFEKYNLNYFLVFRDMPADVFLYNSGFYELIYQDDRYALYTER